MSESNVNLEKDVTLTPEAAPVAPVVEETPVAVEEPVEETIPEAPKAEEVINPEQESAEPEPVSVAEPAPEPEAEVAAEPVPEAEPEPEAEVAAEPESEPEPAPSLAELGKPELVAMLERLAEQPIETVKDEVLQIKAAFFAIRKEEIAQEKAEFLAKGNEEAAFAVKEDPEENRVKDLLNQIKEKRAEYNAAQEAVREANLQKKRQIIEEINHIIGDPDNINRHYNRVQQLQQEFKAAGSVPATADTEVWKSFQMAIEKFYDLLKINKELRDYDFKKNLEQKQQLCADAEALDDEEDIVAAFKKLQELHITWRETGPVAKELREDLWARFKAASSIINKKYQSYFEERKGMEKENADAKTTLCERIEEIKTDDLKTYAAWDEATKKIIALQEEWKKLGFASRKVNAQLFARFRKACDEFFGLKADFFKRMKEELAANLAKKNELCERAEALKDSTDWKKTTDALVALQKEWKTIGPVVKKHSDAVWKRFIAACDHFFEEKKKQTSSVHAVEHENMKAKKEVIAQIKAALESEDPEAGAQSIRDLMARWQSIGHVPFKEKDKLYAEYREAVDQAFEKFDMKAVRANLSSFESSLSQLGGDKAFHERDRLVRTYEQRCSELKTYENNLGFFNAQSKSGNSIVKEMERKIAKLRDEIALLEQKIKLIDEKI